MTHYVETRVGRDFCAMVKDFDETFDIKAGFSVVPERRYGLTNEYLDSI
jgi:hypothetical protein